MRRALTVSVLSLAMLALVPGAALAKTVTVGSGSSGKTVKVLSGDTLRVSLTENPSTGYGWSVTKKPAKRILTSKGNTFKVGKQSPNGPSVGGPGKRIFKWKAGSAGTTSLKVKLYPPGRGTKAVKSFSLTVKVTARLARQQRR